MSKELQRVKLEEAEFKYKLRMLYYEQAKKDVKKLSDRELLEAIYIKLYTKL